jgi:hypothetical protein
MAIADMHSSVFCQGITSLLLCPNADKSAAGELTITEKSCTLWLQKFEMQITDEHKY